METHAVNLEKEEYHHDFKLEFNQEKFHKPLSISAWILSIFFPSTSTNCGRMLSGLVVPKQWEMSSLVSSIDEVWATEMWWLQTSGTCQKSAIWGRYLKLMTPLVLKTAGAGASPLPLAAVDCMEAKRASSFSPISAMSLWNKVPASSWQRSVVICVGV